MKTTLLLLSFITILTCVEAGYSEGFIMGVLLNDVFEPKHKRNNHNHNNNHSHNNLSKIKQKNIIKTQTIDTSLYEFPPQKNPICVEINKTPQLTPIQEFCASLISSLITFIPILLYFNGDDDFKEYMIGYMIGQSYCNYKHTRY